jgi:hypothetical protein
MGDKDPGLVRRLGRSGEPIEQPVAKPRSVDRVDDHADDVSRLNPGNGFVGRGRLGQRQRQEIASRAAIGERHPRHRQREPVQPDALDQGILDRRRADLTALVGKPATSLQPRRQRLGAGLVKQRPDCAGSALIWLQCAR